MKKKIVILISLVIIVIAILTTIYAITGEVQPNKKDSNQIANAPILLEGMKPIAFEEGKEEPIILTDEQMKEGIWYDYVSQQEGTQSGGTSKWANAQTKDGSMWVWIPRYSYKIEWDESKNVGKIDVMFLDGNTNKNKQGQDVTRLGYIVHPAFKDGKNNQYKNGEWDEEITGIWVSKFEAGYAGQKNTASENVEIVNSSLQFQKDSKNILGPIKAGETAITYPVFMGKTYSYNNIELGDMYSLSQILSEPGNPYGFNENVDSHLMKNSEWGAVAYLAHSEYGRNGSKITINNLSVSKVVEYAETVTGYAGKTINEVANQIETLDEKLKDSYNEKSYAWYTKQGKLASTTGNLYGVYDLNGGSSEYVASYLNGINEEKANYYAKSLLENKQSNKYCTIYQSAGSNIENYEINKSIYGDALAETSKRGNGYTSWFGETSIYIKEDAGFFLRSGDYSRVGYSGIFDFNNHSGHSFGSYGFRCILITKERGK